MRRLMIAFTTAALSIAGIVSCRDATSPQGTLAPEGVDAALAKVAAPKVAICHAAGRAGDPRYTALSVSESAALSHLDSRGTPQAGHELDYRVTDRTPCPPPATPGSLKVCKVGAVGVAAGTPFTFMVNGEQVVINSGACASRAYPVGTHVSVSETVPAGTTLASLTLSPVNAGTTNPGAASASVVIGTTEATLTFTNQSSTVAALIICKVAGTNVAIGAPFSFTVSGVPGTTLVAAGAGPGGGCSDPMNLPAGGRTITEAPVASTSATVAVSPQAHYVAEPLQGVVQVNLVAGMTTTVTYTNTSTAPAAGSLVICLVEGSNFPDTDAAWEFAVTGIVTNVLLFTPGCSQPISLPAGIVSVTQTIHPATDVSSIAVDPSGNIVFIANPTAQVMIVSGATTTVSFTNSGLGPMSVPPPRQ
jgi:hypothetical protein